MIWFAGQCIKFFGHFIIQQPKRNSYVFVCMYALFNWINIIKFSFRMRYHSFTLYFLFYHPHNEAFNITAHWNWQTKTQTDETVCFVILEMVSFANGFVQKHNNIQFHINQPFCSLFFHQPYSCSLNEFQSLSLFHAFIQFIRVCVSVLCIVRLFGTNCKFGWMLNASINRCIMKMFRWYFARFIRTIALNTRTCQFMSIYFQSTDPTKHYKTIYSVYTVKLIAK